MNTMNIATRLIASAIATALISSLGSIATAADTDLPHKTVKYADLNVASAQGAVSLYNRIRIASEEVCSPLDNGDPFSKMHVKACMHKTIADAVGQVNQPALAAEYNARNGGSTPMIAAVK
jgi:UrcA family protein